ncbi:S1C family serine protease [Ramlibacter tataouinensis]|uniref:Serine proteases-like protein n=1 Tax=Ramlibacter tataouinensis (strain ATCC BAA-407 / DSM 14655 / LMG 21543 / TTB310) TaxID=365046 RepID=F5XXC7_RAMTT|nr:S1C family serine protease [Ramlibacter tataouinensis]AEG94262.1 serine proteases-like protein [Ramlibacter tataouinensis TTB310]
MVAMRRMQWWGLLVLAFASGGTWAQTPTPQQDAQQQAVVEALTRAHAAVVGVQVEAAEGARSAETLGRLRSGSGVVIAPDGLILTIGYLTLEADSIQVVTADNRTWPARAVAYDPATGFGLVRPLLPLPGVLPVPLGTAADVERGEPLMGAVGGADAGVGVLQLVDKRPFSGYWEYHIDTALFTSPPLSNHSGAPLFNRRGELLGIGSLFVMDAAGEDRRLPGNMFVPVELLKPILEELQQTGTTRQARRPWLGLTSTGQGGRVQVVRVSRDSPAEAAGLRVGDVVLAVDDQRVATLEEFYKRIWAHRNPDDEVRLTIQQGEQVKAVSVKAVDRMTTMVKPAGI